MTSEIKPPDDDRTKALISAMLNVCVGYSAKEAACAVATLAAVISRGDMGREAAYAFAMMAAAELATNEGPSPEVLPS